ncbi:CinA family protein [Campylobacter suis]|uniref:Competence-damage inducible protein n=1 Tax=Campylobacter suis TaxID=2790657 RepID=A0ABM8Q6H9_9BACT|nr:CinA family protein [Campylobacter suis]CAD7288527.1 Putative competence-damage inducible protein [Campylobacter suis]
MKHILLVIGDDLKINKPYLSYIFDAYKAHFGELGVVKFQSKDSELLFVVETLAKDFEKICICCSDESYSTMAKILSTLSGNGLELVGETLAIKDASDVKEGSFLININNSFINLINSTPTKKMAEILMPFEQEVTYFSLLDMDKDSAKILLDPVASPYKISIILSEISPNLLLIRAQKDDKNSNLEQFLQAVKNLFSQKFIDSADIYSFVAKKLKENDKSITFAESCTAGLLASKFASIDGVSSVFDGSLITYANHIKNEWLSVDEEILNTHGAVSEACVQAMMSGALNASKADFAIAVSGIAGPGGGSVQKPVGTVFVGAMAKDGAQIIERLFLRGDRDYIREQSAIMAFTCLLRLKPNLFFN